MLIDKINLLVSEIVQTRFGSGEKTRTRVYHNRISCACPYCGDSHDNPEKKRGNIHFKGDSIFFKCYNCGIYRSLYDFLTKFLGKTDQTLEFVQYKTLSKIKSQNLLNTQSLFKPETLEPHGIEFSELQKFYKFVPPFGKYKSYLETRKQDPQKFLCIPRNNSVVILNTIPGTQKVLGFQERFLHGTEIKYKSYSLEKIYSDLKIPFTKEHSDSNTISLMFGIFSLNLSVPITIFEGAFDSYLFWNSMTFSTSSRNLDLPFVNVRYFYDYDSTGIKKSIEKLESGNSVFLWKKFLSENNLTDFLFKPKVDLTDIAKIMPIEPNRFEKYFSDSKYDIVFL